MNSTSPFFSKLSKILKATAVKLSEEGNNDEYHKILEQVGPAPGQPWDQHDTMESFNFYLLYFFLFFLFRCQMVYVKLQRNMLQRTDIVICFPLTNTEWSWPAWTATTSTPAGSACPGSSTSSSSPWRRCILTARRNILTIFNLQKGRFCLDLEATQVLSKMSQ